MKASPPTALVVITALLLAGYLAVVGWAWASPSSDPQRGMAVGFLMLVTLFLNPGACDSTTSKIRPMASCLRLCFSSDRPRRQRAIA